MSLRRDVEVRNKLSMKEGQEGRTKYGTWEDNLISRVRQLSRHSEALLLYPYAAVELQMLTDEEKKSLDKFRYETRKELRVAMIKKMTTAPTTISSPSDDEEESASPSQRMGHTHRPAARAHLPPRRRRGHRRPKVTIRQRALVAAALVVEMKRLQLPASWH